MLETIIVPLDGSDFAKRALVPARRLAELTGAHIELLASEWELGTNPSDLTTLVENLGMPASPVVVASRSASDAILARAAAFKHPLVCMASHGRSGVGQALLGSVTEATLRGSSDPILVVGPAFREDTPELASGAPLVYCTDGSHAAEAALDAACEWAAMLGMHVWVLQVLEPSLAPRNDGGGSDTIETALVERVAKRFAEAGVTVDWDALHGKEPAHALVDSIGRIGAALVVMGTHGRSGLARMVMGSQAMHVVHHSPCPVLLVRALA